MEWVRETFPEAVTAPFAQRHIDLWEWIEALRPGYDAPPFVAIWPRGGGKSSTVEMGVGRVCAKLSRRFALYICGTQDSAEDHVQTISTRFEALGVERAVNKYGNSRGWGGTQLRTANGFAVRGIGLDTAARGVKMDDYRPDFIIFDDIDSGEDTLEATKKKIRIITRSLIPTGSVDVSILFVQNIIHSNSIAAMLADGRADFLLDRLPVVVHPAVIDLKTEAIPRPNNSPLYRITGGTPTWQGQDLEICLRRINKIGLDGFLVEAQHEVRVPGSLFFTEFQGIDYGGKGVHGRHVMRQPIGDIPPNWQLFGGLDWGIRDAFCFELGGHDEKQNIKIIDEVYGHRIITSEQVKLVKAKCLEYGLQPPDFPLFCDPSMWNEKTKDDGTTRADIEWFIEEGFQCIPANNDRINGWGRVLSWLTRDNGLEISPRCSNLLRNLKDAISKKNMANDVDDAADVAPGHMDAANTLRYMLMQWMADVETPAAYEQRMERESFERLDALYGASQETEIGY